MNRPYALQVLPPALNCNQWMAYTGLGRTSFFDFANRHKNYAVITDGHGNQRIRREWVDAFVMGRLQEQAEISGVKLNQ
jgi:hypothetical protein